MGGPKNLPCGTRQRRGESAKKGWGAFGVFPSQETSSWRGCSGPSRFPVSRSRSWCRNFSPFPMVKFLEPICFRSSGWHFQNFLELHGKIIRCPRRATPFNLLSVGDVGRTHGLFPLLHCPFWRDWGKKKFPPQFGTPGGYLPREASPLDYPE